MLGVEAVVLACAVEPNNGVLEVPALAATAPPNIGVDVVLEVATVDVAAAAWANIDEAPVVPKMLPAVVDGPVVVAAVFVVVVAEAEDETERAPNNGTSAGF